MKVLILTLILSILVPNVAQAGMDFSALGDEQMTIPEFESSLEATHWALEHIKSLDARRLVSAKIEELDEEAKEHEGRELVGQDLEDAVWISEQSKYLEQIEKIWKTIDKQTVGAVNFSYVRPLTPEELVEWERKKKLSYEKQ